MSSKILYIALSLAWALNFLAMTLLGSMGNYKHAVLFELGSRFAWISIILYFFFILFKQHGVSAITVILKHINNKGFVLSLCLLSFWFAFIGIYHEIYIQPFSSALAILLVLTVTVTGIASNQLSFQKIVSSCLIGTAPLVLLTLIMWKLQITTFLGLDQSLYYRVTLPWGLFENPNALGSVLLGLCVFSIYLIITQIKDGNHSQLTLIFVYFIVCGYLLYNTKHITALISLILGIICISFLLSKKRLFFATIFIFIIAILSALVLTSDYNENELNTKWRRSVYYSNQILKGNITNKTIQRLTSGRNLLWHSAFNEMLSSPFVGYGTKPKYINLISGKIIPLSKNKSNKLSSYKPIQKGNRSYHSFILQLVVLYGVPSFVLFCVIHFFYFKNIKHITDKNLSIFILFSILVYNIVNDGLLEGMQFISIQYLFTLCYFSIFLPKSNEKHESIN